MKYNERKIIKQNKECIKCLTLYDKWVLYSDCCGYCRYHKVYLTRKQEQKRHCRLKRCVHFRRPALKYGLKKGGMNEFKQGNSARQGAPKALP